MSIRHIADVSPVEEVGVVTDLEVGTALFEDLGEARDRLPVTWTDDGMSVSRGPPGERHLPKNARGTKGDSQKAISSVGGKDELLGLCLGFIIGIEWLIRK